MVDNNDKMSKYGNQSKNRINDKFSGMWLPHLLGGALPESKLFR